jgi:hypothetical protein
MTIKGLGQTGVNQLDETAKSLFGKIGRHLFVAIKFKNNKQQENGK